MRSPSPLATAEPMTDFIQPCIGQAFCPFAPQSKVFATAVPLAAGVPEAAALAVPEGAALAVPEAAGTSVAAAEAVAVAVAVAESAAVAVAVAVTAAVVEPAGAPVVVPEPSPPQAARSTAKPRAKDQPSVRFISPNLLRVARAVS